MKYSTIISTPAIVMALVLLSSCGKTDTELPTICTQTGVEMSVLNDEIEALAGNVIEITDSFCDNESLSEVRWDVHNAADHAHQEGEEDEGFVLHSGTEWEVLEINSLSGTTNANSLTLDIPMTVRGVWDVVVSIVDEAGNAGANVVTQLHVENEHIPEFSLTTVDGADPSTWGGEPSWPMGSSVAIIGTVSDSDGVSSASISLVRESDESVIWELTLEPNGSSDFPFTFDVAIPTNTETGEHHFEMIATDGLGNAMETGFHVEVE
jgi:hypothetical protein